MKPQHFDILGSFAFAYISVFSLYALVHRGAVPAWSIVVLALLGIGGLAVDAAIVFIYFIRKR